MEINILLTNKNGHPISINPSNIENLGVYRENTIPPFNVPKTKITLKDGAAIIVNESQYEINKLIKIKPINKNVGNL